MNSTDIIVQHPLEDIFFLCRNILLLFQFVDKFVLTTVKYERVRI